MECILLQLNIYPIFISRQILGKPPNIEDTVLEFFSFTGTGLNMSQ